MPIINIPDVGPINFPDGMSNEDITNAIEKDILPNLANNPPPALRTAPQSTIPTDPNFKAGLLSGTTLPADAGPMGNRMIEEVGVAPVPGLRELPMLDASKMPTAEDRARAQFGITPEMGTGEKLLRTLKSGAYAASTGLEQTWLGGARLISDLTGINQEEIKSASKQLAKETGAVGETYKDEYGLNIARNVGSSVLQNIPLLGVGVFAGAPAMYSTMFGQSFLQTYDDSRNEGLDVGASTARSALFGTAEVLGERLAMPELLKGFKDVAKGVPTADLAKTFAKYMLKELPGEQLTYVMQFLTDKGFGLNPEAGLEEFAQGAIDTALVTFGQTAVMGGAGLGSSQVLKSLRKYHSKGEEALPEALEAPTEAPKAEAVPTPQPEPEVAPEAVVAPPTAVAPEATTVAPEATPTPVPPEIQPDALQEAQDKAMMLSELEDLKGEKVAEAPVIRPAPVAPQTFENIEPAKSRLQFSSDIPNENWLQNKRDITDENGRKPSGAYRYEGTVTGRFDKTVLLPVDLLAQIPGINQEQQNVRQKDLDSLKQVMGETGRLPQGKNNGGDYAPFVIVGQDGKPYVSEGNHRIMAAKELGFKYLPVELKYFNGAELEPGILNPKTVQQLDTEAIQQGFSPEQYAKTPQATPETENIERTPIQTSSVAQKIDRSPSLRTELKRLNKMFEKGRISADIVANQTARLLDQTKKEKQLRPLERGKNIILEKMNAAVRRGELDQEALDFATWFIGKNPNIADDIAISIKQPTETSPSGTYDSLRRLVRLYKESENNQTAVHEILHHAERLMPEDVQIGIKKLWLQELSKAIKAAEKGSDQALKDYFINVLLSHVKNDVQAGRRAKDAIANGSVDYSNYQYFNPSEFWAVNATDISSKRFEGDKSFVNKLKQWLREFAEKAKELFGISSNAPIIRALDSLAKSDGKFKSAEMLGEGSRFESLKRTFKAKDTGREVSKEATPKMYSWTMPEREDLILGTTKDDLMYQLLDKNIDTKQVQEAIMREGKKLDDNFNAYQKETLYHGKVAAQTGDFLKQDVLPIVREMNKSGISLEQLEEYLHMRHAEERNDKMNEINQGNASLMDRGSGVSTEDARKYFDNLSKEDKTKLDNLAKQVDGIIEETQDILVRSGVEEKGLIDTWRKTYKHYVPLFREDDDFVSPPGTQMGSGFRVTGATSKRATGSTKKVSNILGNIIAQRERAIVRAEKTQVARALYGMAIKYPNPDFWYAFNPDAVKSKKAAREELVNMGVKDVDAVMALIDAPRTPYIDAQTGQVGYRISPITMQQHNAFPVRINGKDRYIFFNQNNPQALRMAQTLSEIGTDKLDMISNFVGKFTHWLAAVNTQYNPIFGAVNLIRDVKGAMYNLTTTELAGKQREVASQVMPSMKTINSVLHAERNGLPLPDTNDAKLFIQFRDDGGQTGYRDVLMRQKEEEALVNQELKKITDPTIKKAGRHFIQALSDFNDTMENAVRFSAYKTALENDISRDKAAYLAKELTVNFDRKGNLARRINAYFAFFNAAIRGSARIYETLTGPAGKKIMAGGVGLGVLQAAMLAGFPDDEPPEFVRERNFIIPIPGTSKMFTIPYPLGYHVFPGLGRIATEFVFGGRKAGKAVTDALGMFADAFNPLGGGSLGWQTVAPTVLKLPAQVAENKDAFGRPIYREDRATQPTPGYLRSRDTASAVSKFISEALNYMSGGTKYTKGAISPTADEIDFYAGQVTGGVGRELAKTKDLLVNLVTGEETPAYRIPLIGRFYGDAESNAAKTQRFYNNVVEMSNHEQEIKGRQKNRENVSEYLKEHPEARLWQQANNIENQIAAIKRERKELKERGASDAVIKQKNDQMLRLMENFNKQVERIKK